MSTTWRIATVPSRIASDAVRDAGSSFMEERDDPLEPECHHDAPYSDLEKLARTRAHFAARCLVPGRARTGPGRRPERGPRLRGDRRRDAHGDSFAGRDPRLGGLPVERTRDTWQPLDPARDARQRGTCRPRRGVDLDARLAAVRRRIGSRPRLLVSPRRP